ADGARQRLQAVDRAAVGGTLENAVIAALQRLEPAGELRPAGFGLLARRVGTNLHANPTGGGARLARGSLRLLAVDARRGSTAAGDHPFDRLALGDFEARRPRAFDLAAAGVLRARAERLVGRLDHAAVRNQLGVAAIAEKPPQPAEDQRQ